MAYDFQIVHQSGTANTAADVKSRYSSSNSEKGTFDVNNVDDILNNLPMDKNKVRQASKSDRVLKEIYVNVINGWCPNS